MANNKKNEQWHMIPTDEDKKKLAKFHMGFTEYVRFSLHGPVPHMYKTTAPASLYLSNATNEPIGNNEPAEPLSAQPDPAQLSEPAEPDHPAAMVRPDLMNTATVHGPGAAVADHAEIRTDPVPAPTVLIVRKGTRPHKHIEQPQQPARPFPVSMAMLQKNVTTAFVQIER